MPGAVLGERIEMDCTPAHYKTAHKIVADCHDAARAAGLEFEVYRVTGDTWRGRFYDCASTGGCDTVGATYPTISSATGHGKPEAAENALAAFKRGSAA